jgi:DNA repair exonuclease SbcCD ATPase subunit/DNA repair exonuclease SbcCD nuclease subunit
MLKIAHFADVHFRGLTRHNEYRKSFTDAFRKLKILKPDVILVAGDIVHSKTQGISPELISILTWWFKSLGEIAPTHLTLGNHDGLMMNADREDAITPIIRAINHPNIFLHKKSGNVKLADGYTLNVFSCFDEPGWSSVVPVAGDVNIATFHGAVAGSTTDENWRIEGEINVSFFNPFDFAMLGDIHKRQFLDSENRVGYCGSTLQQNYGEEREKGFLFWVIENRTDFATKFVPVANDYPFITLKYGGNIDDLLDSAEDLPENTRFRICVDNRVSNGDLIQIKRALKQNFKPTEIVFKHEVESAQIVNPADLHVVVNTFEDINNLVMDFHAGNNISEKTKGMMTSYLKESWSAANIDSEFSGGKFHIKKMEFDNAFGYGEGNVVNFDSTAGITGIFGKNRSGKSSICGALAYGLYNGTDRGSLKNLHVVNARKNYCNVKIWFAKSGVDYLLERQTVKVTNKKGFTWAPTNLNLFEIDPTSGNKKDLSEEQRRETEKVLRDLVGNLDDFLLTSLSSQGNINKFIDLNAAARKTYLSKFLKLDIFDKLNAQLKDDMNVTKKLLESVPEKDFDSLIEEIKRRLQARGQEREKTSKKIDELKLSMEEITKTLASQPGESFTLFEIAEQKIVVADLNQKIAKITEEMKKLKSVRQGLEESKSFLEKQISETNAGHLLAKKSEQDDIIKEIEKSENFLEKKSDEIDRDKVQVKHLSDVPCDDKFPTCKYIINAKSAQTTLEKKQKEFDNLTTQIAVLQENYASLLKEVVDQKLTDYHSSCQKVQNLELQISKMNLDYIKMESQLETSKSLLGNEDKKLDAMNANVCDDTIHSEREKLVEKKRSIEKQMKELETALSVISEKIGTGNAKLSQTQREKDDFEARSLKHRALKFLSKALSKDGIPLSIIRKRLPIINSELSNILQAPTGFTVELESEEESNDMEIYINYGDSRRIIECGSGMEKMMSSIALRAALINVSNLPKSDIFIVDEGFGALDGKNLESCTALLRELTKYFKSIIVISHVDGIKDVVDNVIEIDNRGIDAHVQFD